MKYKTMRFVFASVLLALMSGCATHSERADGSFNPFCTLVGAAVGGGGAGAIASFAAGPIGAGMFVGGLLGTLACSEGPPPAAQPVASAPPPAPAPAPEPDSDGDGVIDRLDRCPGTPAGTKVDANGCPDILLTLTGVNFKFDSSDIEPASEQVLDQAVDALNKANSVDVRIEGHTDSIGSDAYNLKLSQRRADAVENYLVNHGIAAARLSTAGMGESQPIASNDTADGRYQNRRVEFHVAGASHADAREIAPEAASEVADWRSLEQAVIYPQTAGQ